MAFEFTDDNFAQEVLAAEVAVVDFWAVWCGSCKMISPYIEQLANKYQDQAIIGKLNVDDNPNISAQFINIRSIPAVLYFKNGELVDKQVGAAPKSIYEQKLEALLN